MASLSIENLEVSVSAFVESDREEISKENGHTSEDDERSCSSSTAALITECRICQVEDSIDQMEAPCRCNGTLKFAHKDCIQQWINSRFKTTCEICNQPYEGGYRVTVPPPAPPRWPTRREIEDIRRVMADAERRHAAAGRAELYRPRINAASTTVLGRCAICRIAIVVVTGFYILIIAGKVGGAFQFRIGPPSQSPQPQATPQFTSNNIIPGVGGSSRGLIRSDVRIAVALQLMDS